MKYLCLMDFDNTLNTKNKIDFEALNIIKEYLKNNKLCIISESSFNELNDFINTLDIKCDLYSSSDMKYIINNIIYSSGFKHEILDKIIDKFDNSIYTLYLRSNDDYYVYKYQERLEFLYPKGYKLLDKINNEINYIVCAISIEFKEKFINFINDNNLYYDILGEDKNRILFRLKKDDFSKKNSYNILNNIYKDYKTIGITDSYSDYEMIKNCDIKVAMINGEDEIKEISDIITEYDNNSFGAIRILKKICHL